MTKESCIEEAKRRDKWDRRACFVRLRAKELMLENHFDKSSATKQAMNGMPIRKKRLPNY